MQLVSTDTDVNQSPTTILAKFATGLRYEHIDAASLNTARRHSMDTLELSLQVRASMRRYVRLKRWIRLV